MVVLENLAGRPGQGLGYRRRWRRRRRRRVGASRPSWVCGRFASTCASARLAARASGEAQRSGRAGSGAPGLRGHDLDLPGVWGRPGPTPSARRFLGPRRDFIEKRYVELKKANPDLPILIRECSEVQPKLWARYGECRRWGPGPRWGNGFEKRDRRPRSDKNL